jgi:colanic acid biosynthesis glycosyl transferase WcaI
MLAARASREASPDFKGLLAEEAVQRERRMDVAAGSATTQIIFINRFFYPDRSATSQLLSDLAFHLARSGHPVRVITSRQLYDDPNADLTEWESVDGVAIHRVFTTRFGRAALLGRCFDYLSFYSSVWRSVLALARPGAILVAKTDPPLLSVPALHAVRQRGLRLVNWLQDLYPEVAVELGVPLVAGPIGRGLVHLRDRTLRAASANVVVGERMAEVVRSRGVAAARIHVIPNWCDDEDIRPVSPASNRLRHKWGLDGRFVVGYSGNLGRAHEFKTVLDAAELLRDEPHILFLLIGGGKNFEELANQARERKLSSFRFLPYQDRAALKESLSVPDIHWVSLKPELEGLIVPSKFYGIAAAGRPVIAITARDGEIARLVQRHHCGIVVEPGASNVLADALRRLSTDPCALAEMGLHARTMLETHFSRRQAFASWDRIFDRDIARPP